MRSQLPTSFFGRFLFNIFAATVIVIGCIFAWPFLMTALGIKLTFYFALFSFAAFLDSILIPENKEHVRSNN